MGLALPDEGVFSIGMSETFIDGMSMSRDMFRLGSLCSEKKLLARCGCFANLGVCRYREAGLRSECHLRLVGWFEQLGSCALGHINHLRQLGLNMKVSEVLQESFGISFITTTGKSIVDDAQLNAP